MAEGRGNALFGIVLNGPLIARRTHNVSHCAASPLGPLAAASCDRSAPVDGPIGSREGERPTSALPVPRMYREVFQMSNKTEAVERLRKYLTNGATVYTVLRRVSRSGMSRTISPVVVVGNDVVDLSYDLARAAGMKLAPKGGVVVRGCGMDMGLHVVERLAHAADLSLNHRWL